jgi:hypothetical protein
MALTRCILGKFLGIVCHCFPLTLYMYTYCSQCSGAGRAQEIKIFGTAVNTGCQGNFYACYFGYASHSFIRPGLINTDKIFSVLN